MTDDTIQSTFFSLLPYYWWTAADLPDRVKLTLLINKWPSVAVACIDLVKMPVNVSVRRELAKRLVHTSLRKPDITAYDMRILGYEK